MSKLIIDGIDRIVQDNIELKFAPPFDVIVKKLTVKEIYYFINKSSEPSIMQARLAHYLDPSYQALSSYKVVLKLGIGHPWNVDGGESTVLETAGSKNFITSQNKAITIGDIGYLETINQGNIAVVSDIPKILLAATSGNIYFHNKAMNFKAGIKIGNDSSIVITGENCHNGPINLGHNSQFIITHNGLEYRLITPQPASSEDVHKSYSVDFYKLIEFARGYYLLANANVSVSLLAPPLQDIYNYIDQHKEITTLFIEQNQEHLRKKILNELIIDGQNKEIIQGDIELVSSGYHMQIQLPTLTELRASYPSHAAPSTIEKAEKALSYAASTIPSLTLGIGTTICKVSIANPYHPLFHSAAHQAVYTKDGGH